MLKHSFLKSSFISIFLCCSITSWAAGFDCGKAVTVVEKLICSDTSISALDADLNRLYKNELENSTDKKILQESQVIWLKSTRNLCDTAECLADAYRERIKYFHHNIEFNKTRKYKQYIGNDFVGTYCANPCTYGSTSRPADMVCRFTLGEKYIFLTDNKKKTVKKYSIVSKSEGALKIELEGNSNSWSSKKLDGTKYQLSFNLLPESHESANSAKFSICEVTSSTCNEIESMYIEIHDVYECQ